MNNQDEQSEEIEFSESILRNILTGMQITARIEIRHREEGLILNIENCPEAGRLIGKDGKILHTIQFLLNLILNKKFKGRRKIIIDVGNYRERRKRKLVQQAKDTAALVKRARKPVVLEPMYAPDRRIIHITLQDDPSIQTVSINEDEETGMKSVQISLKE